MTVQLSDNYGIPLQNAVALGVGDDKPIGVLAVVDPNYVYPLPAVLSAIFENAALANGAAMTFTASGPGIVSIMEKLIISVTVAGKYYITQGGVNMVRLFFVANETKLIDFGPTAWRYAAGAINNLALLNNSGAASDVSVTTFGANFNIA